MGMDVNRSVNSRQNFQDASQNYLNLLTLFFRFPRLLQGDECSFSTPKSRRNRREHFKNGMPSRDTKCPRFFVRNIFVFDEKVEAYPREVDELIDWDIVAPKMPSLVLPWCVACAYWLVTVTSRNTMRGTVVRGVCVCGYLCMLQSRHRPQPASLVIFLFVTFFCRDMPRSELSVSTLLFPASRPCPRLLQYNTDIYC